MYKWVESNQRHLLLDTDNKKIIAYVMDNGRGQFKQRKLNPVQPYVDENNINFDVWWARNVIDPNVVDNLVVAKENVEKEFGIVVGQGDLMKFLAQLKDITVSGKIEVIIRVEGLENLEKAVADGNRKG